MTKSEAVIVKIKKNISENNSSSVISKYVLNNLLDISKMTENDFINQSFISKQMLDKFLQQIDLNNFSDLIANIDLHLRNNNNLKNGANIQKSLEFFYNDFLNTFKLNFQDINSQEIILEKTIEQIKNSNHLYFFINENDKTIIADFILKLNNLGFKVDVITDFLKMQEKSLHINKKDLIFYIFDDYKNRQLANVALQFQNEQNQVTICKKGHHQSQDLKTLKYEINYQYFRNNLSIDMRKIMLMLTFEIIFYKIVEKIRHNYQNIRKLFID